MSDYKEPKYLNSPDTVYSKGSTLYGLSEAFREIQKQNAVYLVEGNIDVIQMFQAGLTNTVAPCGTALTKEHISIIKKYTQTVIYVPDHDEPGLKAMHKNAPELIAAGLTVKVLMPAEGKDPDGQLIKLHTPDEVKAWTNKVEDYITGYYLRMCELKSEESPAEAANQITAMGMLIESIPARIAREMYYSGVGKTWADFRKAYKLKIRKEDPTESAADKLKKYQSNDWFEFGFWEDKGAYWTQGGNNKGPVRICTFTMEILYFVWSEDQPKYVCRFTNMFGKVKVTYISTDDFSNVGALRKALGRLGSVFVFEGNEDHLNKLKIKLFYGVREASEPSYMGYNTTGDFFTWANGIYYRNEFMKADKYGMVSIRRPIESMERFKAMKAETQIQVDEVIQVINSPEEVIEKIGEADLNALIETGRVFQMNYYYLPYSSSLSDAEDTSDMKKKFKHFQKPGKSFSDWAELVNEAYGSDNGKVLICFYIAGLYRDIIYRANSNYFPLLYLFGMPQTGKSKAAESIAYMFGEVIEDGINLESGSTATGIRRFVSSVQNGVIWLNEYKNTLKTDVIGMLKGLADGSGKLTGQKTTGLETKSFIPRSAAVICGQDLPTKDPAMFTRCNVCEFTKDSRNYKKFNELKDFEKSGHTTAITCSMSEFRHIILEYKKYEPKVSALIRSSFKKGSDIEVPDRMVLNASSILTPVLLLMEKTSVKFPFTWDEIVQVMVRKIETQITIQHSTDDVEQYFHVVMSLVGKTILEGTHYMIRKERSGNRSMLYLRFGVIHNLYLEAAQRQGINPLSFATMKSYLHRHRSFVRFNENGVLFTSMENKTSAFVFNYDILVSQGIEFASGTRISDAPTEDSEFTEATQEAEKQSMFDEKNQPSIPFGTGKDDLPF